MRETLDLAREVDDAGPVGTARAPGLLASEIPREIVGRTRGGRHCSTLVNGDDAPREHAVDPWRGLEPGRTRRSDAEPLLGTVAGQGRRTGEVRAALEAHASALVRVRQPRRSSAVFCDFDGTFAVQDVGSTLARRYAAERRGRSSGSGSARGELQPWEYNMELLDGLALPEDELDAFLRSVELDGRAPAIWSPGARRGPCPSGSCPTASTAIWTGSRSSTACASPTTPTGSGTRPDAGASPPASPDASCGCGTGVCKRARIREFRERHPGAVVVHVGNGRVSDLCAALASDVVFAKDTLADELEERGVGYEPFADLRDVIGGLERLQARILS